LYLTDNCVVNVETAVTLNPSACAAARVVARLPLARAGLGAEQRWQRYMLRPDPDAKRHGDPAFALPEGDCSELLTLAYSLGARPAQLEKARLMQERGLWSKARRQAFCRVLGGPLRCRNARLDPQHGPGRFVIPYRCKNRYCPECGRALFVELFNKYARLRQVVERLVPHWPCRSRQPERVLAKVDITTKKLGRMPIAEETRQFNRLVRQLFRRIEQRFGIQRGDYGFLWCDEFGGRNTNLHAHGLYAGPWLRQSKQRKEFSCLWREVCEGTCFHGSFIVSVKRAQSFEAGLHHALKYAGKFLSKDPARLAELEVVFHRVRRVHTLAAFYNSQPAEDEDGAAGPAGGLMCPECGAALVREGKLLPISCLLGEGYEDLEEARRRIGRVRVFRGPISFRGPPGQ
jgi:hypothetical protein